MTAWRWCEVFPARGMNLTEVTAAMRVLAGRPRLGLLGLRPMVVFELWLRPDGARWLIGMDEQIADRLPSELSAQCPGLVLVPIETPERPTLLAGRELRLGSLAYPLRTDVAESVSAALLRIRSELHGDEAVVVQWVVGPSQVFTDYPKSRTTLELLGIITPAEPSSDDHQAWRHKQREPLFGVRGRTGALALERRRAALLTRPVFAALSLVNSQHGRMQVSVQSSRIAAQLTKVMGRTRTWSSLVNAAELAMLVSWSVPERDVPSGSRFALPPTQLLTTDQAHESAVRVAGLSPHSAARGQLVRMPLDSYAAHLHVVGPSGSGKSTTLVHWAVAEAVAGRSLIVIEPKGDLVADVLARLPASRHDDVVVLDLGANASLPVVGFNPLRGSKHDAERRADSLLGLFKELFGTAIGPRSSDVLLHALIAVSRLDDGALTDVMSFLTNPSFRRWVLARVSDPLTLGPWAAWFDSLNDPERAQVVAPIGNKLRVFTARPSVRRLVSQSAPKFDLASVFERPTTLLVNLNAGAVGPETARIVGSLLFAQLWELIQRQTTKPPYQRRVVPIIVDEWQQFVANLDFADVLARARGAHAPFTVAHQHLDQLSPTLKAAVLANARARLVFKPAAADSRGLASVLGSGVTAEDLDQLPAYHAAAQVLTRGAPSAAFEVATLELPEPTNDPVALHRASAERYGVSPAELDAALLKRWRGENSTPEAPIGARRKQP